MFLRKDRCPITASKPLPAVIIMYATIGPGY
jgi:hypothetical protein